MSYGRAGGFSGPHQRGKKEAISGEEEKDGEHFGDDIICSSSWFVSTVLPSSILSHLCAVAFGEEISCGGSTSNDIRPGAKPPLPRQETSSPAVANLMSLKAARNNLDIMSQLSILFR